MCRPELCDGNVIDSIDTRAQLNKCCIGTCTSEGGRELCTSDTDCDDTNPCTVDVCGLAGIAGCGYNEITTCKSFGDGCCPSGCDYNSDSDCETPGDDTIVEDCSDSECPVGKECIQNKCLIRVNEGSYLLTENDFKTLGINLITYPFSQTTSEQYAVNEGFVFDGYYTYMGEIPNFKFVVCVTKGFFNEQKSFADDLKVQGSVISEDEYGDHSVRINYGGLARIVGIEKGEWFISISYIPEDEAIANELVLTILNKI
jgi:hypothetical protein